MVDFLVTNPPVLAAVFTLIGGIALKLLEKFLARNTAKSSTRKEFREEWKELLERVDKLEAEVDSWRDKYYRAQEEILTLKREMIIHAKSDVPDDLSGLQG